MRRVWLVLFKITHYDKFGHEDSSEFGWEVFPNLESAREFRQELGLRHNNGGKCHGSLVTSSIFRTTECE